MLDKFYKFNNVLYNILKFIGITLLTIMTLVVFISVIYRYILLSPIRWSGEVSRILFIWISMIGATLALRKKSHAAVEIFLKKFPSKIQSIIYVIVRILIVLTIILLIYYGYELTITAGRSVTPSLRISESYVFAAIPFSAIFMIFFYIEIIFKEINESR
ncbi:MAG: TRAP transporter small permease [bacterium]